MAFIGSSGHNVVVLYFQEKKTNRLLWDRNAFGFISFIYGKKYDGDSDNRRAYNQSAIYI